MTGRKQGYKNQMSIAAARRAEKDVGRGPRGNYWKRWQETVGEILRANGYRVIHLPQLPTKNLNQRLPAGWPDFFGWGRRGTPAWGTAIAVEAKTGSGSASEVQSEVLAALLAVPGIRGGVFYPEERSRLVELAGGNDIEVVGRSRKK